MIKKIAIAGGFIALAYLLYKKFILDKSNSLNIELDEFVPPESKLAPKGSVGLPQYKATPQVSIFNRDLYEVDRNRQGEISTGGGKLDCRKYGTCPPSLNRQLGMW